MSQHFIRELFCSRRLASCGQTGIAELPLIDGEVTWAIGFGFCCFERVHEDRRLIGEVALALLQQTSQFSCKNFEVLNVSVRVEQGSGDVRALKIRHYTGSILSHIT